jgi:glucose-6-phosphate isomerase
MSSLTYQNLDESSAFGKLQTISPWDVTQLSPQRLRENIVPAGGELSYCFGAKAVDDSTLRLLSDLAREQQCIEKYVALARGEVMNTGEKRMVLHHLTRGVLETEVSHDGKNLRGFYEEQRKRFGEFARSVQSGAVTAPSGKRFSSVVQIGIGGSDLGPRALYLALEHLAQAEGFGPRLPASFISNVDPDDAAAVLRSIDLTTSLFILVSKSGTTQETLTNEAFVLEALSGAGIPKEEARKHVVVVTSETSPLAGNSDYLDGFYFDDFIGGRYSSTSAVGGVMLSLAFGPEIFEELLEGAHEADRRALVEDPLKNAALLDALIGVYERNVLELSATAVLPYSQALHRFPAHLQQLDMESNGKSVNREGDPVGYSTGPLVFGEPGTNGQHSFYQLLHQGTDIIPLQFIGFRESQMGEDVDYEGSSSQTKLNANLAAQVVAFARGKEDSNPNKSFAGGRPSSILLGDRLTPRSLGALLAHFENKVMFQGFLWNINSFDQEGVQLGKVLTKEVLEGKANPVLSEAAKLLGL